MGKGYQLIYDPDRIDIDEDGDEINPSGYLTDENGEACYSGIPEEALAELLEAGCIQLANTQGKIQRYSITAAGQAEIAQMGDPEDNKLDLFDESVVAKVGSTLFLHCNESETVESIALKHGFLPPNYRIGYNANDDSPMAGETLVAEIHCFGEAFPVFSKRVN